MTREQCVVVGGGGHARVVIEILLSAGVEVAGFTDAAPEAATPWAGIPCLGSDAELPAVRERGVRRAIVAIGDNRLRVRIGNELLRLGFELVNALHPSAQLSRTARLGSGIAIMANAVLNAGAEVGDAAIINTGATVDHDCRIATGCHVAPGSHLAGCVTLGEGVLVGVGSVVGRGRPLRIGDGATVGAGSVVIEDVPAGTTVVGNPARALFRPQRATQ